MCFLRFDVRHPAEINADSFPHARDCTGYGDFFVSGAVLGMGIFACPGLCRVWGFLRARRAHVLTGEGLEPVRPWDLYFRPAAGFIFLDIMILL